MKTDDRDAVVVERVAEHLDASLEAIDRETLESLHRGRRAALARVGARRRVTACLPYWLTPARLSFAAVGLLAVSLFAVVPSRAPRTVAIDDIEIVTAKEQVAMIEDLEFYRWLAVR